MKSSRTGKLAGTSRTRLRFKQCWVKKVLSLGTDPHETTFVEWFTIFVKFLKSKSISCLFVFFSKKNSMLVVQTFSYFRFFVKVQISFGL